MSDLVERLRRLDKSTNGTDVPIFREAADALEDKDAEIERLRGNAFRDDATISELLSAIVRLNKEIQWRQDMLDEEEW